MIHGVNPYLLAAALKCAARQAAIDEVIMELADLGMWVDPWRVQAWGLA